MTLKDKLPVLAFPGTAKPPTTADPAQLAKAIAALKGALESEIRTPASASPAQDTPRESFSPIGTPNARPLKSAGRVGVAAGAVTPPDASPLKETRTDALTRRITAIHLPQFAMERWLRWCTQHSQRPPEDLPIALASEGAHGPVVYATNRAAAAAGVHIGARIVDMRALCPTLRVEYADIGGDQAALGRLMLWMRRWCPWTAVDGAAGLVLDTTGSDHLFGGEAMMLRDMEARLAGLGLSASLATAPTRGAAWALSRSGAVREICAPADLVARMSALPVRSLRLDGATVQLLQRLGLTTVGDLGAVPRISLARRFSRSGLAQNPLMRLDQMLGRLAEPISASEEPPRFIVQANLPEAVQDPTPHLPALCDALCAQMATSGFGARRICVTVFRTDGEMREISVATAQASRDATHLRKLFDDKLEKIDPGFGFDLITLAATVIETLNLQQSRLDGESATGAALAQMIDRLSARLGAKMITRPRPHPSHIPERAEVWTTALHAPTSAKSPALKRPIKLFDHPEEVRVLYAVPEGPPAQFVWRRITHRVVRFEGPERIAPEWWRDMPGTRLRDYYIVESQTARRFWLYREGVLGDQRGNTPRWFVHGVFA